ncbi:MAG: ketopantoate reductase family protein [Pelosinus sp.]|nr:ketopantoate reductase family protein [Pelosinus sp.]
MKINKVLLIGLGALGSAYASMLYDSDPRQIKIIAGGERARRYNEQGLLINGKRYDFDFVAPEEDGDKADLIIVAVKTYHLPQAIKDMRNYVGENTIILSLLNGITSEDMLGHEFGREKMLYAVSFALTPNRQDGQICFVGRGNLSFGEKNNTQYSAKVNAVKALFDKAGIPYNIPEDMLHTLWWKFMVNVGINQCSAVTRGRYGLFQSVNEARKFMKTAMREVVAVSEKEGIKLTEADINRWDEVLDSLDPASRTSMLEDVECGRKTEVDAFAGAVCALGAKHNIDTPVNRTLYTIIKLIEQNKGLLY